MPPPAPTTTAPPVFVFAHSLENWLLTTWTAVIVFRQQMIYWGRAGLPIWKNLHNLSIRSSLSRCFQDFLH
eukprot:4612725-Pyramimonas_sp.AAC.1